MAILTNFAHVRYSKQFRCYQKRVSKRGENVEISSLTVVPGAFRPENRGSKMPKNPKKPDFGKKGLRDIGFWVYAKWAELLPH